MNSSSLSNYDELKSKFHKYFEIVDKLGNFYFVNKKSTNVYLTIDSEDLNRLFETPARNESMEDIFSDMIINDKKDLFEN